MHIGPSPSNPTQNAACSIADGAKYIGVSEPTLWRMLRDGELARVKLRGRTLVRYSDLNALLERSLECAQ